MTDEIYIPAWQNGTLQPVEKLTTHQLGLRHKAVSVFVMEGDNVLLQQRALGKYHTPGLWANTCCTHPAWGENDADCAQRRLDEELGIKGLDLQYRGEVEYRADVGGGLVEHEVVAIFAAQSDTHLSMTLNPEEVMATRWTDLKTLRTDVLARPNDFTPWLAIYLEKHSALIWPDA